MTTQLCNAVVNCNNDSTTLFGCILATTMILQYSSFGTPPASQKRVDKLIIITSTFRLSFNLYKI